MTGNTKGAQDSVADSVVVFRNSTGMEARGTLVHVRRNTVVFEVYNPYSIVQLSEVLQELRISRRDRIIYNGRAMVSNLTSTGLMLIVTAALVDSWSDLAGLVTTEGVLEETRRFVEDWDEHNQLDPGFRLAVTNLSSFLGELSRWLDGTELAFAGDVSSSERTIDLPRQMLEDIAAGVTPKLRQLITDFEAAADGVPRSESPIHRQFAQRELHPLTLISPWMHRCYTKPFGYAGDYVMLNMVLDDPFQGPNTYAKVLNNSLVTTAPPIAYANRITMLVERLRAENQRVRQEFGRPLRAITVGCGPVNEVQRFLRDDALSRGCAFDLMDFNEPTIRFAQSRVDQVTAETGRDLQVQFVNKSIHELLQEARGKRASTPERYDLVYCAGLFDYLSDRICGALIELFHSWLNPGGLVVVTNVANSDPIVNVVEYLMEWYLIYRDQDHMLRLAPHVGTQSVAVDATGINMFLDVRKDAEQTDG